MKKLLCCITALLFGATSSLAAPAAPVFNKPVKVGEGYLGNKLNKRLVSSGKTVYAGYAAPDGSLKVIRSDTSGSTWGTPHQLQSAATGADATTLRLAISLDPQAKGKKIVHAIWHTPDPARIIVNYTYLTERTKKQAWSTPVKLDLGERSDSGGSSGTSLAVSSSGIVHILQNDRYISAPAFDGSFGKPLSLSEPANGPTYMVIDADDTLYAAYVDTNRTLKMTKKGKTSPAWSAPIIVQEATKGDFSNHIDLVALNSSDCYIGVYTGNMGKADAFLMVSSDGGATWNRRSIFSDEIEGDTGFNFVVSPTKVITFASEMYDASGKSNIKVWRSGDNGATWSKPATVKGEKMPILTLDSAGKAHLLVMDEAGSNPQKSKLLSIKEK